MTCERCIQLPCPHTPHPQAFPPPPRSNLHPASGSEMPLIGFHLQILPSGSILAPPGHGSLPHQTMSSIYIIPGTGVRYGGMGSGTTHYSYAQAFRILPQIHFRSMP